jgi:hypothetical protein
LRTRLATGRGGPQGRSDAEAAQAEAWAAYCEQADVVTNVDGQAAAQSEANGGADTTRRYWALG